MNERKFHHYVKDKTGYVEMEIFSEDGEIFKFRFPRYEATAPYPFRMELKRIMVEMILFAYDEGEYKKFKERVDGLYDLQRGHDY